VTYVLYTVQQHDDLYQIAKQFHVTIPAIQAANGMGNSTFIFPGERLLIPLLASS
jgi:LysM repeat protein